MKILFDLTDLYDHLSGIERYAMELSLAMIKNHPEHDYILVFKNYVHERYYDCIMQDNVYVKVIHGTNKLLFRQVILPMNLYGIKADAYVFLAFAEPWLFLKKNTYSAIHDMACMDCPESMKFLSRWYFRISDLAVFHKSKKIITISKFSGKRILHYAKKIDNKIFQKVKKKLVLVPCGVEDKFFVKSANEENDFSMHRHNREYRDAEEAIGTIREKYDLPEHYILSLSTIEPRKNLDLLLQVYQKIVRNQADVPKLVLAGRKGWKVNHMMDQYEKTLGDKLQFTGFVEDEDLPLIYAGADFFVFPSKYEGFGLPPVEAMAAGTTVLSSNIAVMQEVLGTASEYFVSNDKYDLQIQLEKMCQINQEDRLCRKCAGKQQALKYSWEKQAGRLNKILISK